MLFGPPDQWPDQDLIGYSEEFDPGLALLAYRSGVFPMPLDSDVIAGNMGWWSPVHRGIIQPIEVRISRSLRKSARRYTTTVDVAFDEVLAGCRDPAREFGWIDERISGVYTALHRDGYVHSVETWDSAGRLVGGLYGVHVGGMFAGESMFHHPELGTDASKVALLRLVTELRRAGVDLLDVQWLTPHLASLGAREVSRARYLELLSASLAKPYRRWWRSGGYESFSDFELSGAAVYEEIVGG